MCSLLRVFVAGSSCGASTGDGAKYARIPASCHFRIANSLVLLTLAPTIAHAQCLRLHYNTCPVVAKSPGAAAAAAAGGPACAAAAAAAGESAHAAAAAAGACRR